MEECYITNINHIPKDINDFQIYSNKIRIINIYLPNIRKKDYNKLKLYEKLLLIFNENDNQLLKNLSKGDEIMEKYVKESKEASEQDEVIGMYDKELHDERLRLAENDEYREKGFKEGIKETALKMLQDNLDLDIISKYTELTIEELKSLRQ